MKTPLFLACSIALLFSLSACAGQELVDTNQSSQNNQTSVIKSNNSEVNSNLTNQSSQNNQTSVVQFDDDSDMNKTFSSASQQSSSSSSYQKSSVGLNAANLGKPHMLSVHSSANQLTGEIRIDGKVVKQIRNNKVDINLSPYLSVGEHTVEISARYTPADSDVSIEFNAPGTSNNQQTSGNGSINYQMDVSVR
ncbi:MAG: hypothetical protein QNJ36_10620 [Calothrix sp. MO_167.B42]|nr:hypothetical protein [Calothrix sp. MO_167.B42]